MSSPPLDTFVDDVPTLDELLLPDDVELELDPTLLFPEPVELLSLTPEATTTSSDGSPCEPIPSPPRRRKRPKDELDGLRTKAKQLEQQLQQLKQREEAAKAQEEQQNEGAGSVWRRVARRQLEGKKKAQRENAKLRDMAEGQLAIVHNLEKLLRKRSALEESGAWVAEKKRLRVEYESEAVIFDRIVTKLDTQLEQTHAVFLGNALAQQKTEGQHVQVKPDGVNGMFMEFLAAKIVPFEVQATATQFWRCMAQPQLKLRDGHYSLVSGSEDTLSAKMAFTVHHQQHKVMKEAWFAVKRFYEKDRCVFVWACETKTEGSLSAAQSMRLSDTGWTLVERHSSEEDGLDATIIQSCVRVTTELPEMIPQSHDEVMLLTDIVSCSFLDNLDGIHQAVEDALVEQAMERS